jgi:hypothetical protein
MQRGHKRALVMVGLLETFLLLGWSTLSHAAETEDRACPEIILLQVAAADSGMPSTGETDPPSGNVQERTVPRMGPGRPGGSAPQKAEGVVMKGNRLEALPGYVLQKGPNNQVMARRAGGGPGGGLGATTLACGCDTQDGTCTLLVQGGIATCDNTSGATCKGSCQFTTIITGIGGIHIQ